MNAGNTKRLWRMMEGLLGEASTDDTSLHAADDFAVFFKDKVCLLYTSDAADE